MSCRRVRRQSFALTARRLVRDDDSSATTTATSLAIVAMRSLRFGTRSRPRRHSSRDPAIDLLIPSCSLQLPSSAARARITLALLGGPSGHTAPAHTPAPLPPSADPPSRPFLLRDVKSRQYCCPAAQRCRGAGQPSSALCVSVQRGHGLAPVTSTTRPPSPRSALHPCRPGSKPRQLNRAPCCVGGLIPSFAVRAHPGKATDRRRAISGRDPLVGGSSRASSRASVTPSLGTAAALRRLA